MQRMTQKYFFNENELSVFDLVYCPREDSQLLAESVGIKPEAIALDLGCGSGLQGINALSLGAKKVLCTDINKKALECTAFNAKKLGFGKKIETRESDLFEKVKEKFDCIIFNPPYVRSEEIKDYSTDGGKNGRKILDRFIEQFPKHLEKNGGCFFLQSSLNGEAKTKKMLKSFGLKFEIVARKRLFFEELIVFKCFKQ